MAAVAALVALADERRARSLPSPSVDEVFERIPFWVQAILAMASLKAVIGLLIFVSAAVGRFHGLSTINPPLVLASHVFVFGVAGLLLVIGSRHDRRAALLGAFYLLVASSFAGSPVDSLAAATAGWTAVASRILAHLQPDAWLPLFLWLFVRDFPRQRSFGRAPIVVDLCIATAAAVGLLLFGSNLLYAVDPQRFTRLRVLGARVPPYPYWIPTLGLALPAIPFMMVRLQHTTREERRRATLFLAGLAAGITPMLLNVLAAAVLPSYAAWETTHRATVRPITQTLLLSIPFTTGYAVAATGALDVRLVVRRALRYALATGMAAALLVAPALAFGIFAFLHRHEPVAVVVSGVPGLALLLTAAAGALVLWRRGRLWNAIDRHFFREHYDSRVILSTLAEQSRSARTAAEWLHLVAAGIDRALHVDAIRLFTRDRRQRYVGVSGSVRPLPARSALINLLEAEADPLTVDLDQPRSPLHLAPIDDRLWLADAGARLLVPLHAGDGTLAGLLVLGDKRSGLPYSADDRFLLGMLAISGGLVLENQRLRLSDSRLDALAPPDDPAGECMACGRVQPMEADACSCGGVLTPALLPPVLLGKFALERRIGAGAMGVVYAATDLVLDRRVALKTLPRVSPDRAMRLRREARAMAAVQHRHLAFIYGAESWHGTPLLVVEYLEGGTLADRLRRGPMGVADTIAMGAALASALASLHDAGVLHGDVKPSNIGFGRDGTPKLLDFGLARLDTTGVTHLAGTPLYLCPEAFDDAEPDALFDLWALAVVLHESLAGAHTLAGDAARAVDDAALAWSRRPDLRRARSDCPESLARVLANACAIDRKRRPKSARQFREWLEDEAHGSTDITRQEAN